MQFMVLLEQSIKFLWQNKNIEKLLAEKNSLLARTNNEKFMANAKPELIEQTKNRIEELTVQEKAINELIDSLKD